MPPNSINPEILQLIFDSSPNGIAVLTPDLKWIDMNPRLCEMYGYTKAELFKKTVRDVMHADDYDINLFEFKKLLAGKVDIYKEERRLINKKGETVWSLLTASVVKEKGIPKYIIANIQIISEQKKYEQKLQADRSEIETLLDRINVGVILYDKYREISFINKLAENLIGLSKKKGIGLKIEEQYNKFVFNAEGKPISYDEMASAQVFKTGRPVINEIQGMSSAKNGPISWLYTSAIPIQNDQKKTIGVVMSFIDISDRFKSEQLLKEKFEEVEKLNNLMVGRELRMAELKKEIESLRKTKSA